MHSLGHTPSFRGPGGQPLPNSIAEISWLPLGGVDQWVMIRGESIINPPLILLHGGPGFSETAMFRHFNAALEKTFTVVYWDQRGAGKSRRPDLAPSSLTVEQFISDLDQLVDAVGARLGNSKVTLFGHSWGSALGVLYTARFPRKVATYVGSGQIGDWKRAEALSYTYALETAQRRRHRRALAALRRIGPPPYDAKSVFTERTWLQILDGQLGPRAVLTMGRMIFGAKESSIFELPATMRAFRSTFDVMWPEVYKLNLLELAPVLQVPVFFFLGRRDHFVPGEASVAYIDALSAPSKKLVWFEESGHEPFMDEPERFNAAIVELVRPVVAP